MLLPAELRLRIYEYAFCDNEPDEAGVFDAGDEAIEGSAEPEDSAAADDGGAAMDDESPATDDEVAATNDEIAGSDAKLPEKNRLRQIDLLKAKDHYPDPALLATCKLIHREAEPIFEAATKVFWDSDIFNVDFNTLPIHDIGAIPFDYFGCRMISLLRGFKTILEDMPLLKEHGIKTLRFSWPQVCLIVRTIRKTTGSSPVSSFAIGSDVHDHDDDHDEVPLLRNILKLVMSEQSEQFDGDLLCVPKLLSAFFDRQDDQRPPLGEHIATD